MGCLTLMLMGSSFGFGIILFCCPDNGRKAVEFGSEQVAAVEVLLMKR